MSIFYGALNINVTFNKQTSYVYCMCIQEACSHHTCVYVWPRRKRTSDYSDLEQLAKPFSVALTMITLLLLLLNSVLLRCYHVSFVHKFSYEYGLNSITSMSVEYPDITLFWNDKHLQRFPGAKQSLIWHLRYLLESWLEFGIYICS